MPPRLRSRSFKLKLFWSFNENLGMFITYLLCFYISVFTFCRHVNVLCCAYMTNYYLSKRSWSQKGKKKPDPKANISLSIKVFVPNLLNLFRIFCFSFLYDKLS